MTQVQDRATVTPERVMEALSGYQLSAVLKAAIELELFTHVANGSDTVPALAQATGASEKGVRVLCDFLAAAGFLSKSGQAYSLAPDSDAFLNKNSPTYIGSVSNFLLSDKISAAFNNVGESIKRGGAAPEASTTSPENPVWIEFARSMMPMMMMPASLAAARLSKENATKILDIAAGHGAFGIQAALQNPGSKLVALDWRNVLPLTEENARRFGVGDRFSTIAGSAFEVDLGSGYDLVLVPNFLHHFSFSECVGFLRRVHGSLVDGGRVAIVEFVPNEDRVSPPGPAMFSMIMLAGTASGDAYTEAELRRMLEEAGFSFEERVDLQPSPQTLVVGRKRN